MHPSTPFRCLAAGAVITLAVAAPACSLGGRSATSATTAPSTGKALPPSRIARLNALLEPSATGILIRTPDGLGATKLVPASFTRNDILAPNPGYVDPPQCSADNSPTDGYTSTKSFVVEYCANSAPAAAGGRGAAAGTDPYTQAAPYMVVGSQLAAYDTGVYYPTDANVVDKRCRWDGTRYFCPKEDPGQGPGDFDGKGVHEGDQIDAPGPDGVTTVASRDGACNTALRGNAWVDWVDHWIRYAADSRGRNDKYFNPAYTFFRGDNQALTYDQPGGQTGKAPMFAMDWSSCWVDNKADLVALQNAFWTQRGRWFNGLVPQAPPGHRTINDPIGQRYYWGWNETVVPNRIDKSPQDWDAIALRLPPGTTSLRELTPAAQTMLGQELRALLNVNGQTLGSEQTAAAAVLTDLPVPGTADQWQRRFGCEAFDFAPTGTPIKLVPGPATTTAASTCYLAAS